jgi:hypothetical protein
MKRRKITILIGLFVSLLAWPATAQWITEQEVSVDSHKYGAFIVPPEGAGLTLRIVPDPGKGIRDTNILLQDAEDDVLWERQENTCGFILAT